MGSNVRFYEDAWDEDDILYGWEFKASRGRYVRAFSRRECAKFPKFLPSIGPPEDDVTPLYVKNLGSEIDDDLLYAMFSPFGKITGAHVKTRGDGGSRGFGYVWFSTHAEAQYALGWMNGRFVEGEALYVAWCERKQDRRARLAEANGWNDESDSSEDYDEDDDDYSDDDDDYDYSDDDDESDDDSDPWREDDILYGWEFDVYEGRYIRKLRKRDCAPFPEKTVYMSFPEKNVAPLLVTNLSILVDEDDLYAMFAPFGEVTKVKIDRGRKGRSSPRGFVWFERTAEVKHAAKWMDDRLVANSRLCVVRCPRSEPDPVEPMPSTSREPEVAYCVSCWVVEPDDISEGTSTSATVQQQEPEPQRPLAGSAAA